MNPVLALLMGGTTITWWDLLRDLLLIALSTLILARGPGSYSIDTLLASRQQEQPEEAHLIPNADKYRV